MTQSEHKTQPEHNAHSDSGSFSPLPAATAVTVPGGLLDLSAAFESALAAIEKFEPKTEAKHADAGAPASASAASGAVSPLDDARLNALTASLTAQTAQLAAAQHEVEKWRVEASEVRRNLGRAHAEATQAQADLASIRRMLARAEQDLPQQASRKIVEGLLTGLDTLSTVVDHLMLHEPLTEHGRQAVEMLNTEWRRTLQRIALEPFDAVGLPFDPQRHDIIARIADPMQPNGTVLRQAARGYLFGGRLLRSAQVVVNAAGPTARKQEAEPFDNT